ncbi:MULTISPECIES: MBL fold metallo-hydrolase [Gordonia]|uniref:Metallo-beta-lactamase domain-containing protein n=2 Tax=Gordonia TaxID=2053 RepID=L7LJ54_9ACTN|nr:MULTISPECIES: MBL fold metallo-hydrolase [Gordonia]AUH68860.1 MBL fold metallo-hydrolase [Gordonia sp. YC-JH1]KJR10027.1 beta-lactamase [Gordonia sihwensis]KXT56310.1 beta-lactamase [Gordonia sp. QH-12]MBY4570645.1 MBL fold metallo-hydrolase [Gordonia sihwensis]WFN91263.1 MBL fold metallo-hydrolase [Gordonia sihwensis]
MSIEVELTDDYTGNVSPDPDHHGAHAQRRALDNATIVKMSVGPMDNNVYIVTDSATGKSLLIDAANDPETILALLDALPGEVTQILTTHGHFDHWQGLEEVHRVLQVPIVVGEADADELPLDPDRTLTGGETIEVGDLSLEVIAISGHTAGSVTLVLTERSGRVHLFTGDTLFPGGVGKTWQPGDFEILLDGVTEKLFDRFGDDTVVYPGHGKDTTLGAERPHLSEWRERGW